MELELPYHMVQQIMALVGYHQMPRRLILDDAAKSGYCRLARLCSLELFYWLEQADIRGRECHDQESQLEILDLFRLQAQDFDLWWVNEPYAKWQEFFQEQLPEVAPEVLEHILCRAMDAFEAGLINSKEEALARSYALINGFPKFILMCGPSGSGKSRWVDRFTDDKAVIVSLDDLREEIGGRRSSQKKNGQVMQLARERLKEALRSHQTVVWDATCLRQDQRARLINLAHDYQAMSTIVTFHATEAQYARGNNNRRHAVPDAVLKKQLHSFEFPELTEAHSLIICDHKGEILNK